MLEEKQSELEDSPTSELPVLSELDVVDLDGSSATLLGVADDTGRHPILDSEPPDGYSDTSSTGRYLNPVSEPNVEPLPEPDDDLPPSERLAALEARLAEKDGEIASLTERLLATRAAVARRDDAERALRTRLADETERRRALEARLEEAEGLAVDYASRISELTGRLSTIEQSAHERDAAIAELEAELIEREAQVVERERSLAAPSRSADPAADSEGSSRLPGAAADGAQAAEPVSASDPADATEESAARTPQRRRDTGRARPGLEAELEQSREEAAALAAYIECRRAHWLALEAQVDEYRRRLHELEDEIQQRGALSAAAPAAIESRAAAPAATGNRAAASAAAAGRAEGRSRTRAAQRPVAEPPTETLRLAPATPLAERERSVSRPPVQASLLCLTSEPPHTYRLTAESTVIGRSARCGIRIATHFVSREHARIVFDRDDVLIEDLGSKNGVFVNAVRVARGTLRHGDLVTIGETQFRFEQAEAAVAP